MARKMVRATGWCLTCLDALEAAGDAAWQQRAPWAELAAALQRLCGLSARGPRERLGRVRRLLRGCVPALLAAAGAHLRRPRPPGPAGPWLAAVALTRKSLGELLGQLERGAGVPEARTRPGALSRRLQQLRHDWRAPTPQRLATGTHDARLAAVLWHCMHLAAGAAPPERSRLVGGCRLLLELRRRIHAPPCTPGASAQLQAAAKDLSLGIRLALLRQILDTFTDTRSPLQRLLQAAGTKPAADSECPRGARSLQLLLAAFLEQAGQMRRVAHLVLVCCPRPQTGQDLEATVAGLCALEERVRQLFSPRPAGSGVDPSPEALQALLQAWADVSECLVACFDEVLHLPEFLSVSVQEMTKHLHQFPGALTSGDSGEFSRHVAYLQGRAAHIAQVMNRVVGQARDPIFRNGLRVLIHSLNQASLGLGVAAERCSGERSPRDVYDVLITARNLIHSAQNLREGLDGTNHPAILSPLREQVLRYQRARGQICLVLPSPLNSLAPESKCQRMLELRQSDPGSPNAPRDHLSWPFIAGRHLLPAPSRHTVPVQRQQEERAAESTAQGALAGEKPLAPEGMAGLQEIPAPSPSVTGLAPYPWARPGGLREVAPQLPGRMEETKQALVALVGDWYALCQQLFCQRSDCDLQGSVAVFKELQQSLAFMVQLAAETAPTDLGKEDPNSTGHPEALLQMKGHLEEVAAHAKQLLGQVLASESLQPPGPWEKSFETGCLLWSAAVHALLRCTTRLCRAHGLFLLPLRQAVKDQQGLQEGLDQAAHVSQSLQEAATLSSRLCGEGQVRGEVIFLGREVQVLTDALMEVAQILAASPRPSPSLSTRFELLCLELTLRVQALTGHLSTINIHYEQVLQDALRPSLSAHNSPWIGSGSSLEMTVSGVQAVQSIVAAVQAPGPGEKDLLGALEDLLTITQDMARRVSVLPQRPEEWGLHIVDWVQWEWAARAHHTVAQLRAWKGHAEAWRLLAQCLKLGDLPAEASEQDSSQPQPCCGEQASGAAAGSVGSLDVAPTGPPGNAVLISADPPASETTAADLVTVGEPSSSSSSSCSSSSSSCSSFLIAKVPDKFRSKLSPGVSFTSDRQLQEPLKTPHWAGAIA